MPLVEVAAGSRAPGIDGRTRDRLDGARSGLVVLARDVRRGVHIRSELLLAIAGALHGEEHGPI